MHYTSTAQRHLPYYSPAEEKFNMVSHLLASLLGVGMVVMALLLAHTAEGMASGLVFGGSLIFLYLASSVYHGLPVRHKKAKLFFQVVDHCSIFLLCAGSCTPFLFAAFQGGTVWHLHYLKPYAKLEQAQPQMLQPIKESAIHTIQDKALPFYIRSFANRCDMVFAPTDSMGNYLKNNKVTTPIRVLPTGLSDTSFSPDMEAAMALREKHAQGRPFLLCTVSRLAEEKNISFLLRGLAVLKEIMGGTFRCVIIGSGPQSVELRAFADKIGIAGSVDFVGSIPNEKLPNYHAASDLFLFASQTETQGIVLLEAMAAGKPVVAIDATGSCDVINNGVNGFLTRPSEADWAGAAAQLLQDGRKRAAFSAAARETASAYHSTQIAQKAAFHYRSLL